MRPTFRAILYLPALGLAYVVAGVAGVIALAMLAPGLAQQGFDFGAPSGLVLSAASFAAAIGVTYAFRRWLEHASLAGLGLRTDRQAVWELVVGFGLGVGLIALIVGVQAILGGYRFALAPATGFGSAIGWLAISLATFWFVAASEELVARGYLLQTLEKDWGWVVALGASALLFGVAHLGNPNSSLVSTLGITVAGVLLGASYLATRSLWTAIGLHWSWNFVQGPVFGFPVSGISGRSLLVAREQGPAWLTGGEFGPEASLVAMAIELAAATVLLAWAARRGHLKSKR